MPTPVTECAYLTLKADIDLEGSTPEAQVWQDSITTISAQDGYQRLYWGRQLENPDILMLLIDWDSLESHKKFIAAPTYGPFVEKFGRITDGANFHHVEPTQAPPKVLSASPCIEYITFYSCEPHFLGNVEKMAAKMDESPPEGYHGSGYGAVVEELKKDADGKEGKAVVLWVGWDSKEVHAKFRETELFKENIHLLREGHGGVVMFHVFFKTHV